MVHGGLVIAVATTEADEAIALSDFLKTMAISPHQPGFFCQVEAVWNEKFM